MVAVDDDWGVGVVEEARGGFCEGGEREEFGALDFAEVPFVEFADIDEAEVGLGGEQGGDGGGGDFEISFVWPWGVHGRGVGGEGWGCQADGERKSVAEVGGWCEGGERICERFFLILTG